MAARRAETTPFDCGICLSVPDEQVHQCRNGHLFCAGCLHTHRSSGQQNSNKCPQCRVALPDEPIRCLLAEQSIAAQPNACPHCNAAMTRGEIAGHVERCPRRPVTCSAAACTWHGTAAEREAHEQACAHVVCDRMLKERDEHWQAKITTLQESIAQMQKEHDKRRLEEHCLSAYRDCARHPPGPDFRVEIVKPGADMRDDGFNSGPVANGIMCRLLCQVPGPQGTDWAGGCFPLLVELPGDYPIRPPECCFPAREGPGLLQRPLTNSAKVLALGQPSIRAPQHRCHVNGFMHNNVYPSGNICLTTLMDGRRCQGELGGRFWHPSFTIAEALLSVQLLLNDPNNDDPAQWLPFQLYKLARKEHDRRVREQAARYTAAAFEDLVERHCIRAPFGVEAWTADGQHRIVRGQGG